MAWGTVTIGGIELREELLAEQSAGVVQIAGQEASPPRLVAHVEAVHHSVTGLQDLVVPVVFTDKAGLTGFYRVTSAESDLFRWANGAVQTATWRATLERLGAAADVEIESRMPMIGRSDELAGVQAPVFWHAPAPGATSYLTGSAVPAGWVDRVSSEGTVRAYTGIPAGVAPRWTVAAEGFLNGSARVLLDGIRRAGTGTPPGGAWEVHNGLVRVAGGVGGSVAVSCWDGGAWRSEKGFVVTVAGAALTAVPEVTVLRNDPEEVVVRLTWPGAPGRTDVDLSLRRGARFVTGVMKRHSAATLGVARTAAEAATAVTGGLRATSADADGNRFVMGSSRTITTATGTAAISKATVTRFDFFLGHEVGAVPAAGDAFADLLAQYLAAGGERTRVVRR